MPKATRRSISSSGSETTGGDQGSIGGDQPYPVQHPFGGRECIVVHDHDVLNGRGVNMAHHPGNERFRSLIQSRSDPAYCSTYTLNEKKALAEEIVRHIEALDPPGRFLKRSGKTKNKRGLQGPWEAMSREEAIKKARQALRDCNRPDRDGYAKTVAAPSDVVESANNQKASGLTQQQYVQQLVAANPPSTTSSGRSTPNSTSARSSTKSVSPKAPPRTTSSQETTSDPTNNTWIPTKEWLQPNHSADTASQATPLLQNTTPVTAATSTGLFSTGEAEDFSHHDPSTHFHGVVDVAGAPSLHSPTHPSHFVHGLPASPAATHPGAFLDLDASFQDEDVKPRAISSLHHATTDPLQEEADAAALTSAFEGDEDFAAAFAGDEQKICF